MRIYLSLFICSIVICACQDSFGFTARVASIRDGDTIEVYKKGERFRTTIDLYGIDCPEKEQYFGRSAKDETAALVSSRPIQVKKIREDSNGRITAVVTVKGKNVNKTLVAKGWAWIIPDDCYLPFCEDWRKLEQKARNKRIGLWKGSNPQPPWEWRSKEKKSLFYIDPGTGNPVWRRSP